MLLNKEHDDFYCWYWITKLHNNLYRGNNTACIFLQKNILTASKTEYNHTGIKSIHVVVSIECGYWTTGSSR
jgi:hypothetical protein